MKKNKIWIWILVLLVTAVIVFFVSRNMGDTPAQDTEQPASEGEEVQKETSSPALPEAEKPEPAQQEEASRPGDNAEESTGNSGLTIEDGDEAVIEVPEGESFGGL